MNPTERNTSITFFN